MDELGWDESCYQLKKLILGALMLLQSVSIGPGVNIRRIWEGNAVYGPETPKLREH